MNIASLLAAIDTPDRPAIVLSGRPDKVITFRQLNEYSSRLADGLYERGLRPADRVMILAPLSIDLYACLIALFRLGAAAVFLDPQSSLRQLDRAADQTGANAAICTQKVLGLRWFLPALSRIPISLPADGAGPRSVRGLAKLARSGSVIVKMEPDAPALITFTGGSTDLSGPRGVVRTHRLLIAQHNSLSHAFPTRNGDVDMPAFPIVTLHNLASGVTSIIPDFSLRQPGRLRPDAIIAQMRKYSVNTASGAPAYWRTIAEYCRARNITLPLRRILTGGAPIQPALMDALAAIAPRAAIFSVYGSSEAEPVAVMPAGQELIELAAISTRGGGIPLGNPVADIEVRVLDADGRQMPAGEVGEFWVSGEHVARGYLGTARSLAKNKRLDAEGRSWHGMGDLGYRDTQGRLWLVGRVNNVIMRADQPVYPGPIETVLETLPFIRRAALVGRPDAVVNERAILIVELAKGQARPVDWRSRLWALCSERGWPVDELRTVRHMPMDSRHHARIDYIRLRSSMPVGP